MLLCFLQINTDGRVYTKKKSTWFQVLHNNFIAAVDSVTLKI